MRLTTMKFVSAVASWRPAAHAEAMFAAAAALTRFKLRNNSAGSERRPCFGRLFLWAQVALGILTHQGALVCAAAEAASAPRPAAAATNQAGNAAAAELAWKELQKALRPPAPPESWRTNAPTPQDRETFNKRNGEMAAQVADMASEFYTRFPDHPKAQEARQRELEMRKTAVQLGNVKQVARLNELQDGRAKDPQAEPEERFLLRWRSIEREAMKSGPAGSPAFFDEVQKGLFTLRKEFPERLEVYRLMMQLLQIRSQEGEADKSRALAQTLLESTIQEEAKESVRRMIRKFEFLGKPLELKFTASDGRAVDLAKMRGKVVMIDFWASWCVPCMIELPKVKAAYEKLQPKGFEIVGINLDEEKADMERVLTKANLTWPQSFDGLAWESPLVARFGITSIPTIWLLDKKGIVRDLNPANNLEDRVEKLLQEKTE
jgi:thiol-disulfide isomerase/thioredoxin